MLMRSYFSKSFDPVPLRRIIHKIGDYGATNELTVWLDYFLKDNRQRVFKGDYISI